MDILNVNIKRAGYETGKSVIKDIAFTIQSGELIGLIGPNGAGKSTTIKAILGLLNNVEGKIEFGGPQKNYAYIPERPILYDEMTLWEHLELAGSAFGMTPPEFQQRAAELLRQFRLERVKDHFPATFSKGMQQKIMLILSFLIPTDLYIVDEPFMGLDPIATKDFLEMLDKERERGAGVLMSTHMLDTAERICDAFLLLNAGTIVAQGSLEQIRSQCGMPHATLFECFHHVSLPQEA